MSRGRALLLLAATLSASAACSGPPRPHVFLVTIDTLRADHLSGHGYGRPTSPHLDAFEAHAWSFRNAVTPIPKTGPSFTTLLSGRHPREHGVRYNFTQVPPDLPLLAERMRAAGYRTAAFVGNAVLRDTKGFARGFEVYHHVEEETGSVPAVEKAFEAWADEHDWDESTFVWIHFLDPHGPYAPPPRLAAPFLADGFAHTGRRVSLDWKSVMVPGGSPNKVLGAIPRYQQRQGSDEADTYVAWYDAELAATDRAVGRVLESLERRGLLEPSWVVFTADHGESLGEHDYWFEHGWFAYEPTLHVPLAVKEPGQTGGRVVEDLACTLDVLPTLAAHVEGLDAGEARGLDLLGGGLASREPILFESSDQYPEKFFGMRAATWKLVVRERDGAEELYDLAADPGETVNLVDVEVDRADVLRRLLAERRAELEAHAFEIREGPEDDPETLERLGDIGYGH